MALIDELKSEVKRIFATNWDERDGRVVPEPKDLSLDNQSVKFDRATVLYADLRGSTSLVDTKAYWFSAEVYRTYLYCAARLIRAEGGVITAYDGDRVMALFIGDFQSTSAARCALKINDAVTNIINPTLKAQYPSSSYQVQHVIGIDTSPIHAARIGVRGGNDLVWVGRAANYAAKLANLNGNRITWITEAVFGKLSKEAKYSSPGGTLMWDQCKWTDMGRITIYGSNWRWTL
jgi:class 3 adenylate cyclase